MFDDRLAGVLGDRSALAELAGEVELESRVSGCRKLVIAAAWADAHAGVDHPEGGVLVERLVQLGPRGCPAVAEFAPQGLVGPFACSSHAARSWIVDALTLRHRLPRLWARVQAGEVHHWKARQVATLTAQLGVAAAGQVDEQITPWLEQLPWATLLTALDATMLQVDPACYAERERVAAARREVRATPSEAGLRTLIARGEAGDVAMMLALCHRVAECLADDGDEDPTPVRMSKAIGIIASPAAVLDLLARHADDADPHRPPWEQVAAHHDDDTDPWAEDLPAAGWQSAAHGNYHQPALDDTSWWDTPHPDRPGPDQPGPDHPGPEPDEAPIDPDDLSWYRDHPVGTGSEGIDAPGSASGDTTLYRTGDLQVESATSAGAAHPAPEEPVPVSSRWPQPFRPPGWQPLTPAQRAACAPRVVLHVHLSEQTLRDHHGVVRTDTGPILLEQLHRYLVQHDATITVQPVLDPATAAPADAYEIPLRLRRAMAIRHPRSVFPHSPTTSRTDLDHTRPYHRDGPPGQTSMANLGPLTRAEHRAKTLGRWRSKQPEPGTYLWRSPQNWIMITTNQGTLTLGHSTWAHHLWNTTT